MEIEERHRFVVGVDYGTTYSGVAYLHTSNPKYTDIEVIKAWPGASGGPDNRTLDKAPTEISYEKDGLWGYKLAAGTKRYGCFKLLLDAKTGGTNYDDPSLGSAIDLGNPNAVLQLPPGKSALDVTTDYLKFLYDHIMGELEKRAVNSLESTAIQFVLTTPAIWSHEAQSATREAAKRAGFTSRPGDTISMISEPEAAASYCLRDVYSRRKDSKSPLQVGERIVICDAGGGTVDLVTYTISQTTPKLLVKEAVIGNGGKCGSTAIDRAFLKLLESRVGIPFKEWKPNKTGRGSSLMNAFEGAKRSFATSLGNQNWFIPLGFVEDNKKSGIEEGELKLTSKDMAGLFDPVIKQILMLISQQVTDASDADSENVVSTILLVGGFGESQYLYMKVKEWAAAQPRSIAVINPKDSWSAVVRGAVIDGMENIVQSRKLTQHYGVRLSTAFVEGVHDEEDAYIDRYDGVKLTKDNVVWFAKRGEEVETGRRISVPYSANFPEKSKVRKLVIKGCKYKDAPISAKHGTVSNEGTVIYDLSSLPNSVFQPFKSVGAPKTASSPGKQKLLRGIFSIDMIMGSADLKFESMYEGKCYGETKISY